MKINFDKHSLTQKELKRWVEYNPKNGRMYRILTNKGRWGQERPIRKEVTGTNNRGYKWLKLDGHMYLLHRLAFLYMTGKHPTNEIDHVDGDRLNNRWSNLRIATPFENARNQGIRKDCTSGIRGVDFCTRHQKWKARISHRGDRISLGYYHEFDAAVAARRAAEVKYRYHPNHAKRGAWTL